MKENRKVYSKPDLSVMRYVPSDAVMTCEYTATDSGACLIGGQSSESFPTGTTYYIGTYTDGTTYIIWSYNYGGSPPDDSLVQQYESYIKYIYNSKTGKTLNSTMGWHIAEYDAGGWSGSTS